jgi:KaiC/GvpD/RAD55 family RecA-like ATPase/tetratricopeptide (TPR) repeat protein
VQKPEPLLDKAKQQEKKYNWLEAADLYEQASSLASKDLAKAAELRERIGYCFLRAAFQAETNEQFRGRMEQSVKAYEKTAELNHKTEEKDKEAKIFHAKAMIAYVNARLTPDITKRRKHIAELWKLENDALELYKKTGNQLAIGKMYNNLSEWSQEKQFLESRWLELKRLIIEGINYANKAIKTLSKTKDKYELARAYCWISVHYGTAMWFRAFDIGEETNKKFLKYYKKALDLAEAIGDAYLISQLKKFAAFSESPAVPLGGFKEVVKYAELTKDNYLIGNGKAFLSVLIEKVIEIDPDKQRQELKESLKLAQDAICHLSIIDDYSVRFTAYSAFVANGKALAAIELNSDKKRILLEKAVEAGRKNLRNIEGEIVWFSTMLFSGFSRALFALSEIETKLDNKRRLLEEALAYSEKQLEAMRQTSPFDYMIYSGSQKDHALILVELGRMETGQKKIEQFEKAVSSMEKCVELIEKDVESRMFASIYGLSYYRFGGILEQLQSLTKDRKLINRAIQCYNVAIKYFSRSNLKARVAESYWQIARLKNHLGENIESANNYKTAAQTYKLAAEQKPRLKEFYNNHSDYMQAWSEIENAKQSHKTEEYEQAKGHYEKAANLHKMSELWSYLAPNYLAWAEMEKAEDHSRKDETQQAMETFKQARDYFKKSEDSLQTKLKEITATDEKTMVTKLIKSSDIRQRYCQARISIEEAKIFDRNGKYGLSARSYGLATEKLKQIIEETDYEQPLKELKQIMILSQAWQKMAQAEEKTSPELYLEAAQLFEQANKHSLTKKTSLLALGNSSFCKGLAAGTKFQNTLDVEMHSEAKGYIKSAATYYLKAGIKAASKYAKATQRLFDAYLYMNSAERETDTEKSAKYYHMAEKVLQISVESFMEAKQPEKKAEVQRILETVKEERELAVSLNEVLHAPTITSATAAFTTPTPTSEESVGLERFEHADVQANLIASVKDVKVGESFCLSVEFVNAGKEPALLMRVEDFVPPDFAVVKKPEIYRLEDTCLNMKGKQLAPLKLVEVKLTLQPSKKGTYKLNPKVHYLDELGQNKQLQLKTLEITVEEVLLEDRVSTGTQELDSLLLGGIPEEYSVVLSGPPCDERELIVKNFLKAGAEEGVNFYITTEATDLDLLNNPNFNLFLCNTKPKTKVPDLPNVYRLQGATDLTNLGIALTKAIRNLDRSVTKRRICVEILSDVLVKHGANTTREWISGLITDLGAKGFTMLAVMNPSMHPSDQATAVLDLFDGEISITQTKDPLEGKTSIRVEKLRNQDYIKNPICLT